MEIGSKYYDSESEILRLSKAPRESGGGGGLETAVMESVVPEMRARGQPLGRKTPKTHWA